MKKVVAMLLFIIVSLGGLTLYYALDFKDYFLENSYKKRLNKCTTFDRKQLKSTINGYGFDINIIKTFRVNKQPFEAMVMQNDSSNNYLILIHGKRECPYAMIRGAFKLFNKGFSVIVPVLYAHGNDSLNEYIDYGKYSIEQINQCVREAKLSGANKIGIIGRSMGASSAIIATAKNKDIDAVIAECPLKSIESSIEYKHQLYSDLPNFPFVNIKKAITKFQIGIDIDSLACINFVSRISPRPIFIMSATRDKIVNPQDFEDIYNRALEPKQIWREDINHTKFHSKLKKQFYEKVELFFIEAFED